MYVYLVVTFTFPTLLCIQFLLVVGGTVEGAPSSEVCDRARRWWRRAHCLRPALRTKLLPCCHLSSVKTLAARPRNSQITLPGGENAEPAVVRPLTRFRGKCNLRTPAALQDIHHLVVATRFITYWCVRVQFVNHIIPKHNPLRTGRGVGEFEKSPLSPR